MKTATRTLWLATLSALALMAAPSTGAQPATSSGAAPAAADAGRLESLNREAVAAQRQIQAIDQQLLQLQSNSGTANQARTAELMRQRNAAQQRLARAVGALNQEKGVTNTDASELAAAQRALQAIDRQLADLQSNPPADAAARRAELLQKRVAIQNRINRAQGDINKAQNSTLGQTPAATNRQSILTQIDGAGREIASYDRQLAQLEKEAAKGTGSSGATALQQRLSAAQRTEQSLQEKLNSRSGSLSASERSRLQQELKTVQNNIKTLQKQQAQQGNALEGSLERRREELMRGRNRAQQRLNLLTKQLTEFDARQAAGR